MQLPNQLGSPGLRNSRAVDNAGPAIFQVSHWPVLPAAHEPVVVTARLQDPDGVTLPRVNYRLDPGTNVLPVPLVDDGTGGDAVAGDGLYSAIIPGQAMGTLIAFHIEAHDGTLVTSTFPDDAPVRECLVRFGETAPAGNVAAYRLWMTQATFDRWSTRGSLHNTPLDLTFVYGNQRAIYNSGGQFKGSSFSPSDTPTGLLCGYLLGFPDDDRFLGAKEMVLDWPVGDASGQAQEEAYWIASELEIPHNYRRFVHLFVNGVKRGVIYEDSQRPNSDLVEEFFPEDPGGDLFKMEAWVEFTPAIALEFYEHLFLRNYATTGGAKKLARYRWLFLKRSLQGSANDYTNVFNLVDTANVQNLDAYTAQLGALVDIEEWMRIFALEHIVGNWDSYGFRNGHNMYSYKTPGGKWNLLMFDLDAALGVFGSDPASDMFEVQDPAVARMYNHPPFRRAYFRAMEDAVNGPLQSAKADPLLDARYLGLAANGVAVSPPNVVKDFIKTRRNYLMQQLAGVTANFTVNGTNSMSTNKNLALLSGTAPIAVATILVNGISYPLTWTNVKNWSLRVPLDAGTNLLALQAYDRLGHLVANAAQSITVTFEGSEPRPEDFLVINEIMYHPIRPGASFVEILNTSTNSAFDLSNWFLKGVNFTFAPGTVVTNRQLIVLASDRESFAQA